MNMLDVTLSRVLNRTRVSALHGVLHEVLAVLRNSTRSAVSSVFTSNSWYRRSSRGSVQSDLLSSFWSHTQVIPPEAKLISSHPVKAKPIIFQNKSSDWPDVFIFHVTTGHMEVHWCSSCIRENNRKCIVFSK